MGGMEVVIEGFNVSIPIGRVLGGKGDGIVQGIDGKGVGMIKGEIIVAAGGRRLRVNGIVKTEIREDGGGIEGRRQKAARRGYGDGGMRINADRRRAVGGISRSSWAGRPQREAPVGQLLAGRALVATARCDVYAVGAGGGAAGARPATITLEVFCALAWGRDWLASGVEDSAYRRIDV